jgi:hypothetical protein
MSDEINALFDEILQLIEKQLTFLEEKRFVSEPEMEQYRRRREEIMKLMDRLPPGPTKS